MNPFIKMRPIEIGSFIIFTACPKLGITRATRPSIWHEKAKGDIFNKGYVSKLWF